MLAEFVTSAPEWAYPMFPDARFEAQDGYRGVPEYSGSSATGGFPGLCLDNPQVWARAEAFLKALAVHYKDSPALYGYDLWNEGNTSGGAGTYFQVASNAHIPNEHRGTNVGRMYCHCPASIEEFRKWLRAKYGSLEELSKAWRRYRFAEWSDVQPSRTGGQLFRAPQVCYWRVERCNLCFRDHVPEGHNDWNDALQAAPRGRAGL